MASKKDLTKLQHVYVDGPLHFYYETAADGTRTLRHIRVNQRTYNVPVDGITIDTVPANSVGSEQIKDDTVELRDLSPAAREATENKFAADAEVRTALGL